MNIQLNNGRTITISTERYFSMSDYEYDKMIEDAEMGLKFSQEIENEWFDSHLEEMDEIWKNRINNSSKELTLLDDCSDCDVEQEDTDIDIPFQDE